MFCRNLLLLLLLLLPPPTRRSGWTGGELRFSLACSYVVCGGKCRIIWVGGLWWW